MNAPLRFTYSMSDVMTPLPAADLLAWMLQEKNNKNMIYGVNKFFVASPEKQLSFLGRQMETPVGPAAGPHTQLAQNIIASYAAGARFFELKTVQVIDGEELSKNVAKPCITAGDECYNVEWSTELTVPQALEEYVKAWFLIKLAAVEWGFGSPDGFQFNMSVGYDYAGISSKKIDDYIEGMRNAKDLPIWQELKDAAIAALPSFKNVDENYINGINPSVCDSITLSTLHGCPPEEIEKIATYLIQEKGLNTFIKCNPTLLGYETAREILDSLGFDYIEFDDHHFKEDLQYEDAVPMLQRLQKLADEKGVKFGVKVTNTFPVDVAHGELPGEEMYMSGRSLFPLAITVAKKLTHDFDGKLRISLSGGGDANNIADIYNAGIWPITVATTLLKAGGYDRFQQMAKQLSEQPYTAWDGVSRERIDILQEEALKGRSYRKAIKPLPSRKIGKALPLLNCFTAPCTGGCPINQDIPAYVGLVGQERYADALRVILDKNPLPFITGTICSHPCMNKCTRNFYDESVLIRGTKLKAASLGLDDVIGTIKSPEKVGPPVAVVGGGAAGMACAFFLARSGVPVTLFEKDQELGGIVRYVIPEFRIRPEEIKKDADFLKQVGVEIKTGTEAPTADELKAQGYSDVVLAIGAYKPINVDIEGCKPMEVLDFLRKFRAGEELSLGKNVAIIGAGNTAMDAARAAKHVPGVENSYIIYRRTKRYMPADEEELELALDDGVIFKDLLAPKAYKDGNLICTVMELGEPDESGRRSPKPTDKTIEIPMDTVIQSAGEKVQTDVLEANGIAVSKRGRALVNGSLMTSNPHVYIAGDAQHGPATVVEAIADARIIADTIAANRDRNVFTFSDGQEREKKGIVVRPAQADTEAQRCLECNIICENCVDVCPNRANMSLDVNGALQILHIDRLCNECGNCETFCPYNSAPYKDKFTLFSSENDFHNSKNEGFFVEPGGGYLVRLDGAEFVTDGTVLPAGLADLMTEAAKRLTFFLEQAN